MEMRRKDRQVTDPARIRAILDDCHCCRLAFCDGDVPYIVPLNFGFTTRPDGGYTLYFHSAREGRKIDLIRKTGYAAFQLDTGYELKPGEAACRYSAKFQSVMGRGKVSFIEDAEEKRTALTAIMAHNAGPGPWTFEDKSLGAVCVFRLETEELSCKEHE